VAIKISVPEDSAQSLLSALVPGAFDETPPVGTYSGRGAPLIPSASAPVISPRPPAAASPAPELAAPVAGPLGRVTPPNPALPANTKLQTSPMLGTQTAVPKFGYHESGGQAVPSSIPRTIGGILGTIGGYALSAAMPGIAAQIPSTPLGKIVAGNRELKQAGEKEKQELEKEKAQEEMTSSELVPIQIPGQTEPIMMRRSDVPRYEASLQANLTRENIAGESNQTKRDIAGAGILSREKIAEMEADNKAAIAAGKPQPHITILGDDNKAHIMALDPQTGKYTKDLGIAPPTYAQVAPSLRTIDVIDPETGLPTVETLGGNKLGVSATGAYGHEMAQAGAVGRAGQDLEKELADPANREILGKLSSYIKQGTLGTPLADQQAAYLSSQLKTFAALQPAMHGFRSRSAQEAFEKIIGGLAQDPDATIGAIQGILKTAGAIAPNTKSGGAAGGAIERPANVPKNWVHKDNGPKGSGWYPPEKKAKK
jgi:hypothetical protein